jgi:putative transposase
MGNRFSSAHRLQTVLGMSWKTTDPYSERAELVAEYRTGDFDIATLARRFGVCRRMVYKWVERFETEGAVGLQERSRAPHRQAQALSAETIDTILQLKLKHPHFGAPKLWWKLQGMLGAERCPAESSISRVLQSHGLSRGRGRRRWVQPARGASLYPAVNEVWCADFKGWFRLGNGQVCTPLTISDGFSRYLLKCQGLSAGTSSEIVQALFEVTMREYGLPVIVHTDNGAPFASTGVGGLTPFAVWLLRLGIHLERSRPGCPQDNGRHERMHRTLQEATATPPAAHARAQQACFDAFRQEYNEERPHEGLGGQTPAAVYHPSPRSFPERLPKQPEYPADWLTRQVRGGGQITWKHQDIMITKTLAGQQVGLEPIGDGEWRVHFATHPLGIFRERRHRLEPLPRAKKNTPGQPPATPAAPAG